VKTWGSGSTLGLNASSHDASLPTGENAQISKTRRMLRTTGEVEGKRCCQQIDRYEFGQNGSGSPETPASNYLSARKVLIAREEFRRLSQFNCVDRVLLVN
jgi:hypothetical protein